MTLDTPLRFSRLKLFGKSPAHFHAAEPDESRALDLGAAAHALILGGRPVMAYPGKVRRGKAWDFFESCNPDAIILNKSDFALASHMADAVNGNAEARRVLDGVREETMYWSIQGVECRGTPDVRGRGFITELKTGETSDPRFFPSKLRRFAYHAQLAWYRDGAILAGHQPSFDHYIVAVESAPPHVVTVFRVTDETIDLGRRLVRTWFEMLRSCTESDAWPGYCQSVVDLDLPDDGFELFDAEEGSPPRDSHPHSRQNRRLT